MIFEELQQFWKHVHPVPLHFNEPGLMVDTCGNNSNITAMQLLVGLEEALAFGPVLNTTGNLPVRSLYPMAQANRLHSTILVACPGVHRHRVGIIEKECPRLGNFTHIFAKGEEGRDSPLSIHEPARTDGVTD